MNYANYEDSIMQTRKVKIVGWPASICFASPSTISTVKDMRTLHDGWLSGSIRWVRMNSTEVKAHAEDLQRRCEDGQTIGKKRKRRTHKKRPATSNSSDDESSPDGDKENNAPSTSMKTTRRAKRTPKSQMAPKSKAVITDPSSDEQQDGTEGVVTAGGSGQGGMMGRDAGASVL
jgi:hypothetical protein